MVWVFVLFALRLLLFDIDFVLFVVGFGILAWICLILSSV